MDIRILRALAKRLADQLPELPNPWDVDVLCELLALHRGRPLTLQTVDHPAFPSGMWFDDGSQDYIFVHANVSSRSHRDHIVLHEICHMLAHRGRADVASTRPPRDGSESYDDVMCRRFQAHTDVEEELAECFATMVLMRSRSSKRGFGTPTERRAIDIFGVVSD